MDPNCRLWDKNVCAESPSCHTVMIKMANKAKHKKNLGIIFDSDLKLDKLRCEAFIQLRTIVKFKAALVFTDLETFIHVFSLFFILLMSHVARSAVHQPRPGFIWHQNELLISPLLSSRHLVPGLEYSTRPCYLFLNLCIAWHQFISLISIVLRIPLESWDHLIHCFLKNFIIPFLGLGRSPKMIRLFLSQLRDWETQHHFP